MAERPVLVERQPPVALVILNRPEKYNALTLDLLRRLQAVIEELGADAAIRAIVLRGTAQSFSTGMDLDDLAGVASVADTHRVLGVFRDR